MAASANKEREVSMSISLITMRAGCCERAARKYIEELKRFHLVERTSEDGAKRTTWRLYDNPKVISIRPSKRGKYTGKAGRG